MGFILQDASTGGGGGNSSATAISSAISTNSSAWGTAQNVSFTATGQTLSLPTPEAGAIVPVLKTIVITNTGTNSFTLALAGGTITSAVGLVMNPGSIWTITAQTLTSASISSTNAAQGVIPEFGTVYSTGAVTPTVGQFTAATSVPVPGLSFVASSAGAFQIDANILVNVTAPTGGNQGRINFALFDSLTPTVPVANSERVALILLSGSTAGINESVQVTGALNDAFTLLAGRTYRIQCWNSAGNTNASVLASGVDGRVSLAWNKISGQVPSTGQSIQKAEVLLTGLANTTPAANTWTDITPATGVTVPANIDVDLGYQCGMFRSAAGLVNLRLFNVTDNVAVANTLSTIAFEAAGFSGTTTSFKIQMPATTAPKTYKLQYQTNNASTQGLDTANSTAKLWYIQSGSTATATFTGATQSTAGTGGTVPTPAPGQQDFVLRGNGTWGTNALNLTAGNLSATLGGVTFTITNADPMILSTSLAATGFVTAEVFQVAVGTVYDAWRTAGSGTASIGNTLIRGGSWNGVTSRSIGLSNASFCSVIHGYLAISGRTFRISGGSTNGSPNVIIEVVG